MNDKLYQNNTSRHKKDVLDTEGSAEMSMRKIGNCLSTKKKYRLSSGKENMKKKSAINLKHPLWKFKKTKNGYIGLLKEEIWEKLIDLQLNDRTK